MAINFSSCSFFAASGDCACGRLVSGGGGGGYRCEEASPSSYGGYYSGWGEPDDCRDPVDLLPSDPFGMDLETTFTAAIASCIGGRGDALFADLNYCLRRALLVSSDEMDLGGDALFPVNKHVPYEDGGGGGGGGVPHEGMLFALGWLGLRDLLSVEMVCRSLRSAVQNDPLLWRCIHIDSSLSEKVTVGDLFRLSRKAQGAVQCLSLMGCSRVTDEGLMIVLESNPRLIKLNISGCVRLSIEGLINNLKSFNSQAVVGIKNIKLGKLFGVTQEQFAELQFLLGIDKPGQQNIRKPRFYHADKSSLDCDDECALDIEMCPTCQKYKIVYDCPSESCKAKSHGLCRACDVCIPRCVQCGKCIEDSEFFETFCLEYLCSSCWKNPPPSITEK